jgi:hypothetical protein
MLTKYGMTEAFGCDTPSVPGTNLEKVFVPEKDPEPNDNYSNIAGSYNTVV